MYDISPTMAAATVTYGAGTDSDRCSHRVESARGASASTVRRWDRQRAQGRQRRNLTVAPLVTATIRLQPRRGIRSPERIARTISSGRPL